MADPTVTELLPPFSDYLRTSTDLLPRSQQSYVQQIRLFAEVLGNPLMADITPQMVVAWHSDCVDRGMRSSTLTLKRSALRQFFIWLDEVMEDPQGDRLLKVLRRIKAPRDTQEPARETFTLSDNLVLRMLAAAGKGSTGGRDGPMLHFLWVTGVRRLELVSIRVEDLDMDNRRVRVIGKGQKQRNVRFTQACQADLKAWLELRATINTSTNALFVSARGGPIHPNTVNSLFKKWATRAGVPMQVWPHLMRHTRVTALVETLGLHYAARLAGHSNVNTTQGYFHEDPTDLDEAYDRAMARDESLES